ncbi:hypothetical protein BJ956_001993 [Arthrobacter psychrochitiniphilus]|nr:hypothetical protein [Arthrobacter psychrochitiniphilus]
MLFVSPLVLRVPTHYEPSVKNRDQRAANNTAAFSEECYLMTLSNQSGNQVRGVGLHTPCEW